MKKGIAFFDFDGTITTKDTLLEFIRFTQGNLKFFLGFLFHLHYIAGYKLQFISNQAAKEKVLTYFYKGTPVAVFEQYCRNFTKKILPGLIRPAALQQILNLKKTGSLVVVVSASPENWIRIWAEEMGVDLIASKLEVKEDFITGKMQGMNCHGEEKVRRILEKHTMKDYEVIYAYGDTSGDLPMLKLATESFYKPFRS